MILGDDTMTNMVAGSGCRYSATGIDNLGASEYTLFTLAVDVSGSVRPFAVEIEKCVEEVVKSCALSPRADNLLFRLLSFSDDVNEIHGFKELSLVNVGDYSGIFAVGGMTKAIDAQHNAYSATEDYAKQLRASKYKCNSIFVQISDGLDNYSTHTTSKVASMVKALVSSESVESNISILVGVNVNDPYVSSGLASLKADTLMDQYVEINKADKKTFAKLAQFITNSVSSQSTSLGTGQASQPLVY